MVHVKVLPEGDHCAGVCQRVSLLISALPALLTILCLDPRYDSNEACFLVPPSNSQVKLPHFIAYALHHMKLHSSVTFAALVLLLLSPPSSSFTFAALVHLCLCRPGPPSPSLPWSFFNV
jgi:hypothetical protein